MCFLLRKVSSYSLLFFVAGLLLILTNCSISPEALSNSFSSAHQTSNNHAGQRKYSLKIKQYILPRDELTPKAITRGLDDALWFTEGMNKIERITRNGSLKAFSLPDANALPVGITRGPGDALWFTEFAGNKIGRISYTGKITTFSLPSPFANPLSIVTGPDGALWFTEVGSNKIGRMTGDGQHLKEFTIPTPQAEVTGIVVGCDGALWFAETGTNKIGRITTKGHFSEFLLPSSAGKDLFIAPEFLARGPDGNLWFTASGGIGRITPKGLITAFRFTSGAHDPVGIAAGNGALWFTEYMGNRIGRITRDGQMSEFAVTPTSAGPDYITAGPDDTMWFTQDGLGTLQRGAIGFFRV